VNAETIHTTRASHVARMVRDRIQADARKEIRQRIEAAGAEWSAGAGVMDRALTDFLDSDPARYVIMYHAAQRTHPIHWRGRASDAMNIATSRAVRAIGPLMAYQAMQRALDALCEALGESSPLVQRLRKNG
jgi:hypothetical protein